MKKFYLSALKTQLKKMDYSLDIYKENGFKECYILDNIGKILVVLFDTDFNSLFEVSFHDMVLRRKYNPLCNEYRKFTNYPLYTISQIISLIK